MNFSSEIKTALKTEKTEKTVEIIHYTNILPYIVEKNNVKRT